ncbi:penicillin-binding protein activator [Sandaracinobacter sp. RS1-74]|uniref:penicillin-binding protein activator n=1 Tax=Sandaracinobacteroides sayramensis TaxID=2913411 RepID=UPI001EDC2F42|nr:penicillin-binding protein activator [Sandaracinobacteroides sayramensis]MCG2841850.1 penicillin-binding protein activator [Sandaracinobacteroides sayramensis]
MQAHCEADGTRASAPTGFEAGFGPGFGRRTFATGLALSVLALAACAPRAKPPVAPVAPPPPVEKPVEVKPGETHRIAILVPLTGANAPVGISLANAASLALVDTNKQGVRLSSYDTAALGAAGAANRAIADGAQLILGPLLSADAAAIKAAAASKGITVLSFSNDAAIAGGNLFVLGFQPAQSVGRVVDYAASRGAKKFAGLVPDGVYGQRASVAFTRAVAQNSGQVVALTNFARTPAALPAAARKVTDFDARQKAATATTPTTRPDGTVAPASRATPPIAFEALLVADSGAIAAAFSPHLAKFGAAPGSYLLMGTELWNTEPGLGKSPALKGAVFAAVPDQRFQSMSRRYQARFGGTPSRLASLSYDSMLLAISAAGAQWQLGQIFPQAVLADQQGFAGVDGIFRFKGNIAERGLEVQQVTPQGFSTVSPAPTAF